MTKKKKKIPYMPGGWASRTWTFLPFLSWIVSMHGHHRCFQTDNSTPRMQTSISSIFLPCVISNYLGNPSSWNIPTDAMMKPSYNRNCLAEYQETPRVKSFLGQRTQTFPLKKMWKYMRVYVLCLVFPSFWLMYSSGILPFFYLRFKKHCLMWPQEENVTYLEKEHDSLLRTFNLLIQMIHMTSCREEIIITTKSLSLRRVLVKVWLYVTIFINISLHSILPALKYICLCIYKHNLSRI